MLIQVKGGGALMPTANDIARMEEVADRNQPQAAIRRQQNRTWVARLAICETEFRDRS